MPTETGGAPGSADNALVSEIAQQIPVETPAVLPGGDTKPAEPPADKTKTIFKDRLQNVAANLFSGGTLKALFGKKLSPEEKAKLKEGVLGLRNFNASWSRRFK